MADKRTSLTVTRDENGQTLVNFIANHLQLSRKKAKGLVDAREVFVNQRRIWMARHPLKTGDIVEVNAPVTGSVQAKKIPVLHLDHDIAIINKPPGITTTDANSLEQLLQKQLAQPELRAIHRLDRDTSGCVIFSLNPKSHAAMIELFKKDGIQKRYRAIAAKRVKAEPFEINRAIDHKQAITYVTCLTSSRLASYLQVRIQTGRTHQIRKHLSAINHPVLGDRHYQTEAIDNPLLRQIPRQMLHAHQLSFTHPLSKKSLEITAPLPADFNHLLAKLELEQE